MNIGDFDQAYAIFYHYLNANNALNAFISQCKLSIVDTRVPIDHSLNWSKTNEGHAYWSKLHYTAPKMRINTQMFMMYCELLELKAPYEFW